MLLEMGRDGKFSAKSNAWEDNKVVLEGEELLIRVDGGRWFITKRPAQGARDPDRARQQGEGSSARDGRFCNAVTGVLRCNRCDATLCYGVTVTPQRSLGAARSTGR